MPGTGYFGIDCPSGGKFYASNATAFLGCCAVDTDAYGLCTDAGLRPMTFDPDAYDQIPAQECAASTSSSWYSCRDTKPPFLGCCTHDPCVTGTCNKQYLRAGKLSSNKGTARIFLDGVSGTTTTLAASSSTATTTSTTTITTTRTITSSSAAAASSTSSSTTTTTTKAAASSTATPTSSAAAAADGGRGGSQGVQPGVVAGMVIGIAAAAVAIALLIVWWTRWRRAAAKEKAQTAAGDSPISPGKDGKTPWSPGWPPPDYSTLARGDKTVYPAELPGNVCFELPAESTQSPHGR